MKDTSIQSLLREGPRVVNVGVEDFAADLIEQSAPVVQVAWTPPIVLEEDLQKLLNNLT